MNHVIISTMFILFSSLFITASMLSCSDNEIEQSPCGPNGVPVNGGDECFCGVFYEGEFCEIELREKFIGRWMGSNHSCTNADSIPDGFIVDLLNTDDVSQVRIESKGIFNRDIIISTVADIGVLRSEEIITLGSSVITAYAIVITHDETTEGLEVRITENLDLDESIDECTFSLKKE